VARDQHCVDSQIRKSGKLTKSEFAKVITVIDRGMSWVVDLMQVQVWESKKGGVLTSDIVSHAKYRSVKERSGPSIEECHGSLIWHDEVQSLGARTSKNGGELTREIVKCEVTKHLFDWRVVTARGHVSGE
jgi:hypothetical protein